MAKKTDTVKRFWGHVDKSGKCWMWLRKRDRDGYGRFWADGKEVVASRYSYFITYGPIPNKLLVLHKCDNPPCVRPSHLFLGTAKHNFQDAIEKGRMRHVKGEAHGLSKLSSEDVKKMREARELFGWSYREIAVMYGVSRNAAHCAITGRTWDGMP